MSDNVPDLIKKVQYWLRLTVLLQGPVRDSLLVILHNKQNDPNYTGLPTDPGDLYQKLQNNYAATIQGLFRRRVIKQFQYDLLFPTSQRTESSKFDVTLIIILITNCTNLRPLNFWRQPISPLDTSIPANVIRAREWRNHLFHEVPYEIDENDFNHQWRRGVFIVMGLGSTFPHADLKKVSLDAKEEGTFLLLKVYIDSNNARVDKKLEEMNEILGNRIDGNDAQIRREMERIRDQIEQLKAHIAKIEELLVYQNRIAVEPIKDEESNIILPEVTKILRQELGENWKEILFDFHEINWRDVERAFHVFKENQRKYFLDEIKNSCLLDEVYEKGDRAYVLQVLQDVIGNNQNYKGIIDNLVHQVPNTNHWKMLNESLIELKRPDMIYKIESSILLKNDDRVNELTFAFQSRRRETSSEFILRNFSGGILRGRVLDIIHMCLGEEWTSLSKKSKIYQYLALRNGQLTWDELKTKLEERNMPLLIETICQNTLLTKGDYFINEEEMDYSLKLPCKTITALKLKLDVQ